MALKRRYAQCPHCHTIWTTHDVPPADGYDHKIYPCPDCNVDMHATYCQHDTGKVMLAPGWHRLSRREDLPVFRAEDTDFIVSMFINGEDENGERWGDALITLPRQTLSIHDDKMVLLAYRFDTFLPRLSDADLQQAMRLYTANIYKILGEMTMRGITETSPKKKKGKTA